MAAEVMPQQPHLAEAYNVPSRDAPDHPVHGSSQVVALPEISRNSASNLGAANQHAMAMMQQAAGRAGPLGPER